MKGSNGKVSTLCMVKHYFCLLLTHYLARSPLGPFPHLTQKFINPPCALLLIARHHREICWGFFRYGPGLLPFCVMIDLSFKRDIVTSALLKYDRFWRGLWETKQGLVRKSILTACYHPKRPELSKNFYRRQGKMLLGSPKREEGD